MSYPVKSVITCDYYLTKEGNDTLAVPGTGDVNDTEGSRRHSRRNEQPKARTRNQERRFKFR